MVFSLIPLVALLRPIDFPPEPMREEIVRGVAVYRQGKGPERLYLEDRVAVGRWFDGRTKRDVDQVVWLSPGLISRWLGYLEAKEKWFPGELSSRWNRLKGDLGGRLSFVVQLSAMPKMDLLDDSPSEAPDPSKTFDVRFLLTTGGSALPRVEPRTGLFGWSAPARPRKQIGPTPEPHQWPLEAQLIADLQARELSELGSFDWTRGVPFGRALASGFSSSGAGKLLPLGDFYSRWLLLQTPIPPEAEAAQGFEVWILGKERERIATFLRTIRPPKQKAQASCRRPV